MGPSEGDFPKMTDPNRTVAAARDVLARAKALSRKADRRLLLRFEQKIRLVTAALAEKSAEGPGQATGAGLRAVLARAEKQTKTVSHPQARAIAALRAHIARIEEGSEGAVTLGPLVESLAADT